MFTPEELEEIRRADEEMFGRKKVLQFTGERSIIIITGNACGRRAGTITRRTGTG